MVGVSVGFVASGSYLWEENYRRSVALFRKDTSMSGTLNVMKIEKEKQGSRKRVLETKRSG
jgi:hypothetical protein